MTSPTYLHGLGYHVPEKVMTNADLERLVETNDEWIVSRTGIRERRVAGTGETCSTLASAAGLKALAHAGMSPGDVTHIIVGTFSPDAYIPSASCLVQKQLGNAGAVCFDVSAACSGFLYSLQTARAFLHLEPGSVALVSGSEVVTSRVNFNDRTTCVLFGDGAGAVVVTSEKKNALAEINDIVLRSDGTLADLLTVNGGGSAYPPRLGETVDENYFVQMQGQEVFKHAVRRMHDITIDLLGRNGLTTDDVDLFIPHQANMRIIDALARKIGIPLDKIFVNLERYGNTSAASIPIALTEAFQSGAIRPGMRVVLTSIGGGFTWASCLMTFAPRPEKETA